MLKTPKDTNSNSSPSAQPIWLCGAPVQWERLKDIQEGYRLLSDPAAMISGGLLGSLFVLPVSSALVSGAIGLIWGKDTLPLAAMLGVSVLGGFFLTHWVTDALKMPTLHATQKLFAKESAKWLWNCGQGQERLPDASKERARWNGLFDAADRIEKKLRTAANVGEQPIEGQFLKFAFTNRTKGEVYRFKELSFTKGQSFILLVALCCGRLERHSKSALLWIRSPSKYQETRKEQIEKSNNKQEIVHSELMQVETFARAYVRHEAASISQVMKVQQTDSPVNHEDVNNSIPPAGSGPKIKRL